MDKVLGFGCFIVFFWDGVWFGDNRGEFRVCVYDYDEYLFELMFEVF